MIKDGVAVIVILVRMCTLYYTEGKRVLWRSKSRKRKSECTWGLHWSCWSDVEEQILSNPLWRCSGRGCWLAPSALAALGKSCLGLEVFHPLVWFCISVCLGYWGVGFNSTDLLNRHLLLSLNSCCYPRLRLLRLRFMALGTEENCFTVLVCFTFGKCGLQSK